MSFRRQSAKSTTPSSGHQGKMVDPKYPELTPLLQMVQRKKLERIKVEAEMASSKKRGAEGKRPVPSEEEQSELKTLLESASRRLGSGGGHDVKRNLLALFEASIRVASHKQSRMTDIPQFHLPEKATFDDLMKLKLERLQRYEGVRSFDIEGLAPVTPPTELDTYQMINITRPSDTDPEKAVSVAQILIRESDNYFCGVRPTPADPTAAGGFFVFSNVILPWFFGKCHQMSCSSRYATIANMQVCLDSISLLVEEILRLDDDNCKHITAHMISLLEIGMFLFGEFPRMQGPVDLLQDNFDLELIIYLTAQVLFEMRNWSYLSKTGFAFYLGMLETSLDVIGHKETFLKGWKQMTAAVTKFEKDGHNLDLLGANGFFSLRKLVGNRLHLLKFDEEYVKRLIIRKRRQHKGRMEALKEDANEEAKPEIPNALKEDANEEAKPEIPNALKEDANEEAEPEIPNDVAWKEAKKEYEYWLSLMVDDRDMLIKVLSELNVDLSDKDQSEGLECAPPKSCPSEPSSPGEEKILLDGFSQDSTLPSELPHVPKSVSFSEELGGDMLIKVLCELNVDLSDKDQSEGLECAPPKSCPSEPSSPGEEKILLDGFSQDSTLPSELPHEPKSVNFSELCDSISTPERVTPCSSMESDSDKRSLNTKLKESKLNADAKSFTPLACQRPPQPPVSDAAHYYPNSMLSTPGSGLPVGMGFPESYGSMHIVYNAHPGPLPQGHTYLSWPQFLQPYSGAPIFDSAQSGSSPQGYAHPSRPQLYGGVPSANGVQPGSLPQGYTHPSGPQLYGGVPSANGVQPGSLPQGYTHLSRPQLYGGVPSANGVQPGSLPQGYTHLSRPQPYGGVPTTANGVQPGSLRQGYAHSSWPQPYARLNP